MNENDYNPKQSNFDYSMRQQSDNVFVLAQLVNSLSEDTKVGDLRSDWLMRHMLSELQWLREQTKQIDDSIDSFLDIYPNHPQRRTLHHLLAQITDQIEATKEAYRQLSLSAYNKPYLLPQHRNYLQTLFHSLYLSLSRLQKQLRCLDETTPSVAGD